ncbi:FecCD family ABC transporter permease [Pseudoalteromonas spongiae]|uniref:Iron chelate uptake ABC transporter family permease subunit n=1 Tax=Pseudoalteromonas spongiae TaxID=298657 RepID=A0ABU8EVE9_9GAMM
MTAINKELTFKLANMSWLIVPRDWLLCFGLTLLLCCAMLLHLMQGKMTLDFATLLQVLLNQSNSPFVEKIVFDIRLPRALTACFAGGALAISGAIFQSLSKNPLGSPDIIGFTTGAATGAITHFVFFEHNLLGIALFSVLGGLSVALLVFLLAKKDHGFDRNQLVLIGIGVGATLSAINGLLLVKGNLDNTAHANIWLAGSLSARTWFHALMPMFAVFILLPIAVYFSRAASLIEMGMQTAHCLGVNVRVTNNCLLLIAIILAALATGSVGPIAFIALASAHIAKRLLLAKRTLPIFTSALIGALLLVLSDLIGLLLADFYVLPVGRVVGVFGGVYLLMLLTRKQH